ncbi:MAG TPA: FAD-dependent oxidoreductase [Acidimicrobiales bacterium]|nr:FAD-dependent oxidoreductase [Acidimicrobiales bacterium]
MVRVVVVGGGPAGNQAASRAASLGAHVTLVERDIVGGAAHLWDCIPSKAMIATAGALSFSRRMSGLGLVAAGGGAGRVDHDALGARIEEVTSRLQGSVEQLLVSQKVRILRGEARLTGPRSVAVSGLGNEEEELGAEAIVVSTGSRPRVPDWAEPDGERVLTTRQAYPPPELPDHLVVVGSGVTGVEFVHMFSSLGSKVSLIVSRQHVLPHKDAEVAAALEEELLRRGVRLYKGARAQGVSVDGTKVSVECDDGRVVHGSHVLLAVGSVANSDHLGLERAGVQTDKWGYITVNHHCQTNVPHIYAAGDVSGKLPLSSVASMQGRKVAEHIMGLHTREHRHIDYDKAASAVFTEPEIADVGLAEAEAFASGRKIRVTKVPFGASAKALINDDPRGFVKIISDPATGVVLGGCVVGNQAAELISVLALAVTAGLKVTDLVESCLVHPSLAEALADAAD